MDSLYEAYKPTEREVWEATAAAEAADFAMSKDT